MTLKFYIKKEEDSLYFEHFFKVVYNKARKIGGLWIKLRKLKFEKQKKPAFMLTVAIPKRNKLQNIIVLTPKDGTGAASIRDAAAARSVSFSISLKNMEKNVDRT